MSAAVERVLGRLEKVKRSGSGWTARCPAHEDRVPSLGVNIGDDGRVLLLCRAGCSLDRVLAKLELEERDLFESNGHRAAAGPTRMRVGEDDVRRWQKALLDNDALLDQLEQRGWTWDALVELELGFDSDAERIVFPVREADGALGGVLRYAVSPNGRATAPKMVADAGSRRNLFPAPERVEERDEPLLLVEGEPDAVTVKSLGLAAVAVPGVQGWCPEWAPRFRGRCIVVCFDCDGPGREAAKRVAGDLAAVAADVRILELDPTRDDGYDVSDLVREATTDELREQARRLLVDASARAPRVEPPPPDGAYLVRASEIKRARVEWLESGLVPLGAVTVLYGQGGLGKSLFSVELAARLTTGKLGEPGVAIFVTAEDSLEATLRPRLEAAGADLERVGFAQLRREGVDEGLVLPDDIAELERLIESSGAVLVIIDPLVAHLAGKVNSWHDQSVRTALAPLHRLAERQGCAVVAILHTNKSNLRDPLERIGGSVGFGNAARSVLLMAPDPDDPEGEKGTRRVLAHVKCNLALLAPSMLLQVEPMLLPASGGQPEVETVRIVSLGESSYGGRDLLGRSGDDEEHSQLSEAEDFLRAELATGALPAKEVKKHARDAGISERTLDRAKHRLSVKSEKTGFQGAWEWRLP